MKILRSCAMALGMALAMAGGAMLGIASIVLQPTLRYIASACEQFASGIDKLDRELAHKFAEDVQMVAGVSSGLQRESNGYRQSTAADDSQAWPVTA